MSNGRTLVVAVLAILIVPIIGLAQATIGLNFAASQSPTDFDPPDPMGAVGVDHFVQLINNRFSVFYKSTGNLTGDANNGGAMTMDSFWSRTLGDSGSFTHSFDPRIIYDHTSGRWFAAVQFSVSATNPERSAIAVSQSSDPQMPNGTTGSTWSGFEWTDWWISTTTT